MTFDWQNIAALAIVGLAAGYLVRAARNALRRRANAACGTGCGKCPGGSTGNPTSEPRESEPRELVTLEPLKDTPRRD